MITLDAPMESLNTAQSYRYARLYRIVTLAAANKLADDNKDETGNFFIVDNGTTLGIGTEFTALTEVQRLIHVAVWLKGTASPLPSGFVYAELYASDGGAPAKPTGSVLATSALRDAASIGTASNKRFFVFDGYTSLVSGQNYFIVIKNDSGTATSYLSADGDSTSSDDGNYAYYQSGSWTVVIGSALRFEIMVKPITELYLTSHDHSIEYNSNTYSPTGGHSSSNIRSEAGMKTRSAEFLGVLSSPDITDTDLNAGVYDNAEITEYMVDFMFPWCGTFYTEVYYIADIAQDGEIWVAQIRSKMAQLKSRIGNVYSHRCRYRLGEAYGEPDIAGCKIDITEEGVMQFSAVTVIKVDPLFPKSLFWVQKATGGGYTGISASMTEKWFKGGFVTCDGLGNNNEKISRHIKSIIIEAFTIPRVRVELAVAYSNDIEVGDTFTFVRGCDKYFQTCLDEYSNSINFGGFPYIPARKIALWTPPNTG